MKKSQTNVVSNEYGLKWIGLKWIGLKWMWSQMNVVSNECYQLNGLKWIGLNSHGTDSTTSAPGSGVTDYVYTKGAWPVSEACECGAEEQTADYLF